VPTARELISPVIAPVQKILDSRKVVFLNIDCTGTKTGDRSNVKLIAGIDWQYPA
jgi:hypothetical protein